MSVGRALLLLAMLVALLVTAFACHDHAPEARDAPPIELGNTTVVIGDGVIEAIERDGKADVLISIKSQRVFQVLSILADEDFTLRRSFKISAAISGLLTETGLEKLATHPAVVAIGLNCCLYVPSGGKVVEAQ